MASYLIPASPFLLTGVAASSGLDKTEVIPFLFPPATASSDAVGHNGDKVSLGLWPTNWFELETSFINTKTDKAL